MSRSVNTTPASLDKKQLAVPLSVPMPKSLASHQNYSSEGCVGGEPTHRKRSWDSCEEFMETEEYERWMALLAPGDLVDVLDLKQKWYPAIIVDISADRERVFIHYQGWAPKWDEWIVASQKRITPLNSHVYGVVNSEEKAMRPALKFRSDPLEVLGSLSHDKVMLNRIRSLFFDSALADVILIVQRSDHDSPMYHRYFLHEVILSSRCPGIFKYFCPVEDESKINCSNVTIGASCSENGSIPIVTLAGIPHSFESLEYAIEFIYTGATMEVKTEKVVEMLSLFSNFEVSGFQELVISWVTPSNVVEFLHAIADKDSKFTSLPLRQHCIDVFRENASLLMELPVVKERLFSLPQTVLVDLLQHIVPHLTVASVVSMTRKRRRLSDPVFPASKRRSIEAEIEGENGPNSPTDESKCAESEIFKLPHITLDQFFADTPELLRFIKDMEHIFFVRSEQNSDLAIQVDDMTFYAHSCIVATQSGFFAALIHSPMTDKKHVSLNGLFDSSANFEIVLRYLYSGHVPDMPLQVAIDLIKTLDFFDLKSQVLKRACRSIIIEKTTPQNVLSLLYSCHHILQDSLLFSSIVSKLGRMKERNELVEQIADAKVLVGVVKCLFESDGDFLELNICRHLVEDTGDSEEPGDGSESDQEHGPITTPCSAVPSLSSSRCIFVLSDECSQLMQNKDFSNVQEVLDEYVGLDLFQTDRVASEGPMQCSEKISKFFGGRDVVHAKNGELYGLVSKHLTRVYLTR